MKLYFKCYGLEDSLIDIFIPFLKKNIGCRAFYGVIASIYYLKQQRAISLTSLKAQLYQAHLIMVNPSVVNRVPQLPIDSDLTYEGSVFLHIHGMSTTINCACGFPIHSFTTNKVYEGTLFYYIHNLIVNGKEDELVSLWDDPILYMEAEVLAKVILGDEEIPVETINGYMAGSVTAKPPGSINEKISKESGEENKMCNKVAGDGDNDKDVDDLTELVDGMKIDE